MRTQRRTASIATQPATEQAADMRADAATAAAVLSPLFERSAATGRLPTVEDAEAALEDARVGHMRALANVCVLLASGLTPRDAAIMAGVPLGDVRGWQRLPAFRKAVDDCFKAHRDVVYRHAVLDQQRRVMRLASRLDQLDAIVDARAERYEADRDPSVPAEALTGLMQEEIIINARTGDERRIFKLDTAVLREMREIEKQAAIETGQWQSDEAGSAPSKLYARVDIDVILGKKEAPPISAASQAALPAAGTL